MSSADQGSFEVSFQLLVKPCSRFRPRAGVVCVLPFLGSVAITCLGLCLWSTPEGHSEGPLFDGLRPTLSNASACRLWGCSEPSQASAGWLFR